MGLSTYQLSREIHLINLVPAIGLKPMIGSEKHNGTIGMTHILTSQKSTFQETDLKPKPLGG